MGNQHAERISIAAKVPKAELVYHLSRYHSASRLVVKKDILDVACGTGYGANCLASAALFVVGLDISNAALSEGAEHFARPNLGFVCADAHALPFAQSSFDAVVSIETIEHLPRPREFLTECARVLRPAGTLVLSTPNKDARFLPSRLAAESRLGSAILRRLPGLQKMLVNPFHIKEFECSELRALMDEHFDVVAMLGLSRLSNPAVRTALKIPIIGRALWEAIKLAEFLKGFLKSEPLVGAEPLSASPNLMERELLSPFSIADPDPCEYLLAVGQRRVHPGENEA